ncbi:MAG: HAMP domain-containing histidine kinase [Planctomycetes bacterium]|nr:HAMP domain-containing histidine kinase [Planctomycetota bacterium]
MSLVAPERLPGLIGHELRNPLAAATTGALLLRDMVDADDPRAPILDGVLRDLDRVSGLIDGWLQTARTQRSRRDPIEVDTLLTVAAARHGAEVVCGAPGARIAGDRCLLERALDNLLENARQAGARRIRLAAQTLGPEVTLHVEDDGCGIPAGQAPHVFTAGWSGRGGTGLGLHAVEVTARVHGGRVACVPLAHGTRFSLTLPRLAAGATQA